MKTLGLILSFLFFGLAMCLAAHPQMGTWKLNQAKSKITPGTAKFTTVTFKTTLGNIKATGTASPRTVNRFTSSGRASSTAKIIRSQATRTEILASIEKWMIEHWKKQMWTISRRLSLVRRNA